MSGRFDVIIVGGGIAGLSAALILGRCRRRVLVCDHGRPRNAVSQGVHGFLSRDGISPWELRMISREQLSSYTTVQLCDQEVVHAARLDDGFDVQLADGRNASCRKLLLATGLQDRLPDIPGIAEFYGISVHHCPLCDAWEHKDERLVVYGNSESARLMALELLVWSVTVALCTDGPAAFSLPQRERLSRNGIPLFEEGITGLKVEGGKLRGLILENRLSVACDAVFFASAQEQASPLPERLGCPLIPGENEVRTASSFGVLSVPGLYVVGNACQGIQLAIVAAAEAASAAHEVNGALAMEDHR
jgi:thioredoxin reductase